MIREVDGGLEESVAEKRIYKRFEANLKKISNEDVARIDGNSSLGIVLDNDQTIGACSVVVINFDPEANARQEYVVVTVGIQRIKNSLVSVLVSEKFNGSESIKKSISRFAEWSASIKTINATRK